MHSCTNFWIWKISCKICWQVSEFECRLQDFTLKRRSCRQQKYIFFTKNLVSGIQTLKLVNIFYMKFSRFRSWFRSASRYLLYLLGYAHYIVFTLLSPLLLNYCLFFSTAPSEYSYISSIWLAHLDLFHVFDLTCQWISSNAAFITSISHFEW